MSMALQSRSESEMDNALKNLKSHYKFIGIATIIFLVLYLLMFVVMIALGGMMGAAGL